MDSLEPVNWDLVEILLAIQGQEIDRLTVLNDKHWTEEAFYITVDSFIIICNCGNNLDGAMGIVRYKGPLPQREGTWFGIELGPENAGKGTSDGVFRKQRFFTCADDCAVFVSIFKIRSRDGLHDLQRSNYVRT